VYKKDLSLQIRWVKLITYLGKQVGKRPKDLNAVLFLIGVQELGAGKQSFSKEEKQDLMHIAICKVLSLSGYYELTGKDEQGWPHWRPLKKLPHFDLLDQEKLLKMNILDYFEQEYELIFES
jgi:tRNA A37 threonylcarbamoyladenosine biosynthesis protein TsaE